MLIIFSGIRLIIATQEKQALIDDTLLYLEEKGYDVEIEIEDLYVVNIGAEERVDAAVVTFKDETDINYFYTYEKDSNQIIQSGYVNSGSNQSLKHEEN